MRLEQSLRKKVRAAVRNSPALARAARRQRSPLRRPLSPWVMRLILGLFVGIILYGLTAEVQGRRLAMNALAIWVTGTTCWRAIRLAETLYQSGDLLVYVHLPLSDDAIFQRQWNGYLWRSGWLVFYFFVIYCILIVQTNLTLGTVLAALGLAILQTGLMVALSCLALRWLPPLMLLIGSICLCGLGLAAIYGAFEPAGWSELARFLPAGWVHRILLEAVLGEDQLSWLLALPAAMMACSAVWSRSRLEQGYALAEPVHRGGDDPEASGEPSQGAGQQVGWRRGLTAVEESIRQREFLRHPTWEREGVLERLAGRWFTRREQVVADFMIGPSLGATRAFHRAWWASLASTAIIYFLGEQGWVVFVCLAVVATNALPLLPLRCRGFVPRFLGNGFAPPFAGFPVSYAELWRMSLKLNVLRMAGALPLAAGLGCLIGWKFGYGWSLGLLWASKVWALVLVLQPTLFVLQTSGSVNEQIRFSRLLAVLFFGLIGLGLIGGVLLADGRWMAGLCLLLLGLISWLFLRWHRRGFDRGHFDLVRFSGDQ